MNKNKNSLKKEDTPLIKQYNDIKSKYPNTILLFQVGDFYEIFGDDAIKCSKILDIVLTKRSNNKNTIIHLAGFPYHSLNTYLPKLIRSGHRVAICDQLEEAKKGKNNIVKRGVIELVTPGTAIDENILQTKSNNFLASIHVGKKKLGLSFLDISTGEFFVTEDKKENILQYLKHFNPSEILFQKKEKKFFEEFLKDKYYTFLIEDWIFNYSFSYEKLISHFQTNSLKGFGIDDLKLGITASGVILNYLYETQHYKIKHIYNIKKIKKEDHLWIDDFTFRNLEVFRCFNKQGVSLIDIIDKTNTPMGGRLLKHWIHFPLIDIIHIEKRHRIVEELFSNVSIRTFLQKELKEIYDIERIISKMSIEKISPREVITLYKSLMSIVRIQKKFLSNQKSKIFLEIGNSFQDCNIISKKIVNTIHQDPPHHIEKGNVIVKGFSKELDEIRHLYFSKKEYLEQLCSIEQFNTGIHNLKIGYNNIFGYFFEVRTSKKDKVPSHWIRKQTLTNSERYTTEKLKNYEAQILNAEQKILSIEKEIFHNLINQLLKYIKPLQENAKIIAELDVLYSFSISALENNYVKPKVNHSFGLCIKKGRHPVIERQFLSTTSYIPNDIILNKLNQQILIITGPNMSGKSAILRQTALIILMAHIGSFVPAQYAEIGLIDKIFSRVGASDNISLGESTFMVEMNETANILNNLSKRSFLILDEIGRGTSTYDGISIAWSIVEFLHKSHFQPLTLFATHYHELNKMSFSFKRIKNYHVYVKEIDENIIFMRKMIEGGSEHSYGIHVAKISGMPIAVIHRAKEILKKLNEKNYKKSFLSKKKAYFLLREITNVLNEMDIDSLNSIDDENKK
ncbi:MAG: DNA mismatch repair protein MutS [Flavobacteriales bacterium]|jgi:DNA mismatch repair protein MutS|uniref:DNA mismatch repair protein MutS n=1 Tax=Blattabacterium sp. (Mastotermes darwiniensis) TaxID=39768 RepID=UPI000231DEB3|nr:DNA mismatch repair protein MutS [Blattabacterium sp. (Mastotermes darwiniensis)]AER40743.1 putative DNA mismatch repair protein MutS [Blattabacterium sp. (Mastotermes darwiniensis) str. MADAR]MDR1805126.1 DNA mismatch repair protein MutS [Flavobacteriales bacterium]